jgi:hypothetical protein
MIIYYVGAEVDFNSQQLLFRHFGTLMPRSHATLVYSRNWFPYKTAKCFPLILEPPYEFLLLRESLVLKFENYRFFNRHIELRNLGASSDHDHFTPHITIQEGLNFIPNYTLPKFPITLSNEYYGTWEEGKD